MVVPLFGCVGLLTVAVLCTAHVLPTSIRSLLFAFSPLALVLVLVAMSKRFLS